MDSLVTPPPRPSHTPPKSFRRLCDEVGAVVFGDDDTTVTGVAINASLVVPGDVFVAIPGKNHHGASFTPEAVASGAAAIVTDQDGVQWVEDGGVPYAVVESPREVLGLIASSVYRSDHPLPAVYAVTGTNGKTSVSFFLDEVWRRLGHATALSNSTERRVGDDVFRTRLTTPEANELHALAALASERGIDTLCLEASAQAIGRFRLTGLRVAVAGFTNLSHDHLNDYGDMDTYLAAKAPLFTAAFSDQAVICVDTPWGKELVTRADIPVVTVAAASGSTSADWLYHLVGSDGEYTDVELVGPDGTLETRVRALGEHMVQNLAVAVVMVASSGVSLDRLRTAISPPGGEISAVVPGRLEKVSGDSPVVVFLDAGRSADAYTKTLTTVRALTDGQVVLVAGAAGGADPTKRGPMGDVAARLADVVVITDDDPRFEDPDTIRRQLLEGAVASEGAARIEEIADPEAAIDFAIGLCSPGDVVVWSGRGSQNYRDIRGQREAFSASDVARTALRRHGHLEGGSPDA